MATDIILGTTTSTRHVLECIRNRVWSLPLIPNVFSASEKLETLGCPARCPARPVRPVALTGSATLRGPGLASRVRGTHCRAHFGTLSSRSGALLPRKNCQTKIQNSRFCPLHICFQMTSGPTSWNSRTRTTSRSATRPTSQRQSTLCRCLACRGTFATSQSTFLDFGRAYMSPLSSTAVAKSKTVLYRSSSVVQGTFL